jgi:hypothetical protein
MKNLARRALKRVAGPVTKRLRFRVGNWAREATGPRFEDLERKSATTQADVDGLERYVPALLNAIAAQNATHRANVRTEEELARLVQSVLERFESVRNELLSGRERYLDPPFEPKVLHPERVEAARENLRLNLGGGHDTRPGYVIVDSQVLDAVDVLADPRDLPFESQSVSEIRADHILERYSRQEIERRLIPHWISLLRPGGSLVAVVRDGDAMVRGYVAGDLSFDELRDATFGDPSGGEIRSTMFSPATLAQLLADAGVDEVIVRNTDPMTPTHEIEVVGRKPPASPTV